MRTLLFFASTLFLFQVQSTFAQLPDGSIAPDWTLTDINGVTYNLYEILDQGKTVVLDFSATWCGPCWNYHNSGALEAFYDIHGPDGTDESMVFFLEADMSTGIADLYGQTGASQGNWVQGTPYPIIDCPDPTVPNAYNINFFPTIYKVCSDRTIYEVGQVGQPVLSNWIQSCTLEASLESVGGTTCYGLGEGYATISASGGYGSIGFNWSNGVTTQNLENAEAGLYSVTVSESQGKNVIITDILLEGPTDPIILDLSEVENLACFGDGSGAISTNATGGNGGHSYAWNTGQTTPAISGLTAGSYQLTVTDVNACAEVFSFDVEEPDLLEMSTTSSSEFCGQQNASIAVMATGGTTPYTLSVNGNAQSGLEVSDLPAGNYDLEIEDANGCQTTASVTIEEIPAPEILAPVQETLDCNNFPLTISVDVTNNFGPVSYYWTTSSGNIVEGQFEADLIVDAAGEYFLQVEDLETGCSDQTSVSVIADLEGPEISIEASNPIDCDTQSVTLTAAITGPYTDFSWTTSDGNIVSGSNTLTPVVDQAGTYILTASNMANGCIGTQQVTVIDQGEEPQADFNWTAEGLNVTFTSTSQGEINQLLWNFGNGNTSIEEMPAYSFSASGTYQVCLEVTNGCGSSQVCQNITVNAQIGAIEAVYDIINVSCFGEADGAINITAQGGSGTLNYQWVGPNGFQSEQEDISGLEAGTYLLEVTDEAGQSLSLPIEITEPDAIEVAAEARDAACFGENTGSIALAVNGGTPPYTYVWSHGQEGANVQALAAGEYSCIVTDMNGCSRTETVIITEPEELTYEINTTQSGMIQGGAIDLTVSGGVMPYTYAWSNGATTEDLENLPMGLYSCVITDANGCIVETIEVFINRPQSGADEAPVITTVVSANPFDKVLHLKVDEDLIGQGLIIICNPVGQVMTRKIVDDPMMRIDASRWPSGLYFISTTYRGEMETLRVIKAH